jgi:hypothetical protein
MNNFCAIRFTLIILVHSVECVVKKMGNVLLVSTRTFAHVKFAQNRVDDIDHRGQFHQHAYEQILRAQIPKVKEDSQGSESYGLAVEHSAHDRKVVGSIPMLD